MDADWQMRDYAERRLHSPDGLSRADFTALFGCPLPETLEAELAGRVAQGMLERTEEGFRPSERGLFSLL